MTGHAQVPNLSHEERAELHALRDLRERFIGFGGDDDFTVMPWVDAHRRHAERPYIGCPFCRDQFVLADEAPPRAGVMHPVDEAFYDLAVKERDYERRRADRLQAEVDRLVAASSTTQEQRCSSTTRDEGGDA